MFFNFLKDIFAPKKCYSCGKEGHFLCEECLDKIGYYEPICPVCKQVSRDFDVHFYCKKETIYLDKVMILTHYQNKTIQKLIKDAKFYHKKDILEDVSAYLSKKLFEHIEEKKDEILLIPTPMYFWKKLKRGYNQSEILVKSMSKNGQIPYNNSLVYKTRKTKPQSHLTKIERIENLKNAFILDKNELEKYKQKTVVIVDDVVSTGTTVSQIAKLLKKSGIRKVYAITIASD